MLKQQCHLWNVWLTWLAIPVLVLAMWIAGGIWAAGLVLAVVVVGQVIYLRAFPRISKWLGYGPVEDVRPQEVPNQAETAPQVTLYTANLCPFCPILKRRLLALQRVLQFDLKEVDVTFRPDLIKAKGIRSVPVVEANGRTLVGNATTAQLVDLLTE